MRLEDLQDSSEGYHFHILIDSILDSTQDKLSQLAKELSQIYPCKIEIHTISNDLFKDFNAWGFEGTQNFTTYYRICLERFMPKDLDKCLYLDVDMLVMSDVRELFAIDLGDKILGVVRDVKIEHYFKSKKKGVEDINFNPDIYFNAGFLLVNLTKWRENGIERKCFEFLNTYESTLNDQDALNIATNGENMYFGYEWNIMMTYALSKKDELAYRPFKNRLNELKVCHFTWLSKPWLSVIDMFDMIVCYDITLSSLYKYHKPWWKIAEQTPMFCDELMELRENLNTNAIFDLMKAMEKQQKQIGKINAMQEQYLKQQAQIDKLDRRLSRILNPHKAIIAAVRKLFKR